jgi:regulator of RNase E activity RraB
MDQRHLRLLRLDHSVAWEMSGIGCKPYDRCTDFLIYTLPSMRLIFYSAGAVCCSAIDWETVGPWLKPLFRAGPTDIQETDRALIDLLLRKGADLTKPREVKHYLYVPTAEAASQASIELRSQGYEVEERMAADADQRRPHPLLLVASSETLVNLQSADETRRSFENLAATCGGEYDGWEAAAEP